MRLSQFTRQKNINTTSAISYLSKKNTQVEYDRNTKLEDSEMAMLWDEFGVEVEETPATNESVESAESVEVLAELIPEIEETTEKASTESETTEEKEDIKPEPVVAEEKEAPENTEDEIEIIKAPVVKLDGPTVVGKIDLPGNFEGDMVEVDGVMMDRKEARLRKRKEKMHLNEVQKTEPRKKEKKVVNENLAFLESPQVKDFETETVVVNKKEKKADPVKLKKEEAQKIEKLKELKRNHYLSKVTLQDAEKPQRKKKVKQSAAPIAAEADAVVSQAEPLATPAETTVTEKKGLFSRIWGWIYEG